ncbi:E3 ubiquitin-protein ligase TRIM50 isoform X2 [Gadus morhua]|nr:E3 ubiquitin-protein ligase TRIM50-like isoform X2 [Gadus morhua]
MDLKSSPTSQGGGAAPSAGDIGVLQLEALCLSSIDSNSEQAVQPFPRSPKLLRKLAKAIQPSTDDLAAQVHELQAERSKAEAHIKSLKKRKADLSRSAELMKQQVREHFEEMHASLRADERATLDSLEQDLRRTGERLDQVTRGWEQHLGQVGRAAGAAQRALRRSGEGEDAGPEGDVEPGPPENQRFKKPDASEAKIRLNEGRFKRLLRALHGVSRELRAQLPRKALLLDSVAVTFDRHTCHPSLSVTGDGRGLGLQAPGAAAPPDQHPLRFDRVFCALASVALATGQSYWEVDVRCCDGDDGGGGWAVGVAYACLPRKGRDKGAKLGRNRHSWCVEWREGQLAAWHNDRSVALGVRARPVGRVGVWVNHDKGQLLFYDAGSMELLQAFSAAMTPVFDRARHQFIEPLFPAVRLLEPRGATGRPWANHVEICDLAAL